MGFFDIFKANQYKAEIEKLQQEKASLEERQNALGFTEYEQVQAALADLRNRIDLHTQTLHRLQEQIATTTEESDKAEKRLKTATNKLSKAQELYKSIDYAINGFHGGYDNIQTSSDDLEAIEELSPSVILRLHCLDIKDLRKAYRENDKRIEQVLQAYSARYTTKANQTIYKLMVIALRAELQNILYNLKYEKLDVAIEQVKQTTAKYLDIAAAGNQNIASTLTKFIGEIEYLFINAVKIEYNYYVKKEQAKQEQLAIREQMRQEAEERKALEAEKKKIEKEEKKYSEEIQRVQEALEKASAAEKDALNRRILELQQQLADVIVKKEDVTRLQNGKAGNIYIISNLGAFGDKIFKIGMTRRLDPQDRVDELGSASVPFKFDVHSFIFSEDAVALEGKLHDRLNDQRVNKVNLRKEFFYSSVDELEQLVQEIDPSAEFTKTMIAEEFRQSQSSDKNYVTSMTLDEEDDE